MKIGRELGDNPKLLVWGIPAPLFSQEGIFFKTTIPAVANTVKRTANLPSFVGMFTMVFTIVT
jgi:hypothetical protein